MTRNFAPPAPSGRLPWRLARLLSVVLWALAPGAQAQYARYAHYQSVGLFGGMANYHGDLTWSANRTFPYSQLGSLTPTGPSLGGFYQFHIHPHASIRLSAMYGRVGGDDSFADDPYRASRNLSFISDIGEVSVQVVYEWFGNYGNYRRRPNWSPYVFAGVAAFYFDPYTYQDEANLTGRTRLRPLRTEGQASPYGSLALSLPFGIGLRRRIADRWDLRAEIGLRYTSTDFLDDAGASGNGPGGYASADQRATLSDLGRQFADRRLSVLGEFQRANSQTNDWYAFSGLSLAYILYTEKCPKPPRARRRFLGLF